MTDRTSRRRAESRRVEAFSDGVFSIAITLLVLELAVPAVSGRFGDDLIAEAVSYVAYLAAFGTIGVLWMGHHTVFTRIAAVDSGL
ncbi:MAG: potassium channel family protein, partial [Chloroflexota bacterium]|nr:potassium channel family protein [Chloroflexota bacterium]